MRSRPLENPEVLDFQATVVLCLAAIGLSVKRFAGFDLELLVMSYDTWPSEPWRLLTSTLLHGDWMHLIFNVLWIWRFGKTVEPLFGTLSMIGIVVALAAVSAAAEWAFIGPSIGLSGVGFGLFGILFALGRYHKGCRGVLDRQTSELFGVWFVFCVVATWMNWMPIANIAHGMGFVLGALFGWTVSQPARGRWIGTAALTVLIGLTALGATVGRPYINYSDARAHELAVEGLRAIKADDPERALPLLEKSLDLNPDASWAWTNLAYVLWELGREEEADLAAQRAKLAEANEASTPRVVNFGEMLPGLKHNAEE